MREPDKLEPNIHALKKVQRVAWQQLARPSLTAFDRREIRNEIKQSDGELEHCLEMISERLRFRARPVGDVGDSLAKLNFRLFA